MHPIRGEPDLWNDRYKWYMSFHGWQSMCDKHPSLLNARPIRSLYFLGDWSRTSNRHYNKSILNLLTSKKHNKTEISLVVLKTRFRMCLPEVRDPSKTKSVLSVEISPLTLFKFWWKATKRFVNSIKQSQHFAKKSGMMNARIYIKSIYAISSGVNAGGELESLLEIYILSRSTCI